MRALIIASVACSFLFATLTHAEQAGPAVRLEAPALRSGAVPRVRIAPSQRARGASFYARTGDGMVQAVRFLGRYQGGGEDLTITIPANREQLIRMGGTPGIFVAARTGMRHDREAFIVVLAEGRDAAFGSAVLPEGNIVAADMFFLSLAEAARRHEATVHIVPYSIAAPGFPPDRSSQGAALEMQVTFDGFPPEAVFAIADILAVEVVGPLEPIAINVPGPAGITEFRYRSLEPKPSFRNRLASILDGLGLHGARVVDEPGGNRLTVIGPAT